MSVESMIQRFGEELTVRRPFADGTYVAGTYEDGGYEEFTIFGSVQPLRGLETVSEDILRRTENMMRLYSDKELKTTDTESKRKADKVIWRGEMFEVQTTEDWRDIGIPHWKGLIKKVTNKDD